MPVDTNGRDDVFVAGNCLWSADAPGEDEVVVPTLPMPSEPVPPDPVVSPPPSDPSGPVSNRLFHWNPLGGEDCGGGWELATSAHLKTGEPAYVISHGWNLAGSMETLADLKWPSEIARAIRDREGAAGAIFAIDWLDLAIGDSPHCRFYWWGKEYVAPPTRMAEAMGGELSRALAELGITDASELVFIGHSLGSRVVTTAAMNLKSTFAAFASVGLLVTDPPESWTTDPGWYCPTSGPVHLEADLTELVTTGSGRVWVEAVLTQFGDEHYKAARTWDLRNAADNGWGTHGWGDDHFLAHAWLEGTISPGAHPDYPTPNSVCDTEGANLARFFPDAIVEEVFWQEATSAGYGVRGLGSPGEVLLPDAFLRFGKMAYYPFRMRPTPARLDQLIVSLSVETFETVGNWGAQGISYLRDGVLHILTNSPSYVFAPVEIPADADVMRFTYGFETGVIGDQLSLFIDDALLWIGPAFGTDQDLPSNTSWFDVSVFAGQTVTVMFVLTNGTAAQAHATIDNIEFADTVPPSNSPPVAEAGPDRVLSADAACVGTVILDASGSWDDDNDALSYFWYLDGQVLATGARPTLTFPLGEYDMELRVRDLFSESAPDAVRVSVVDTTPPVLSLNVSPDLLWPPNHKMVEITPSWTVSDTCDASPIVELFAITMNEGEETLAYDPLFDATLGDGHTLDDIQVNGGIFLRAERAGTGDGRVYTLTYRATDASGNETFATATVTVPKSQ